MPATPSPHPSTFGSVVKMSSGSGFQICAVRLPAGLRLRAHSHLEAQICFVLEGSYQEQTEDGEALLRPGSVLFRPAGLPHANEVGAHPIHAVLIDLRPEVIVGLKSVGLPHTPVYVAPSALGEIGEKLRFEINESDQYSHAAISALVQLATLRLLRLIRDRDERTPPSWYALAVDIVNDHFTEKLCLSSVARKVGVSAGKLASAFRRYYGRSLGQLVCDLRLKEAQRQLLESDVSIAEIAQRLGYFDQAHFGRHFRKRFQISPACFRRIRSAAK